MAKDPTSRLVWYRKPFGPRVASHEYPFFRISQPSDTEDDDARRRDLADLAGL